MRKTLNFFYLPLALLLVAGKPPSKAPPPDADEQEASEEESEEATPDGEANQGEEEKKVVAPGQVHTVTRGDTLWDLSQEYLGSPWYWPKVWSYNPEIANPHWIYPGNKVRFFPSGEEAPSRVEVAESDAPRETPSADTIPTHEQSDIQVMGKIGFQPGKHARIAPHGFVTQSEVEEAGVISGSPAESLMLSYPDTVYLTFKNRGALKLSDRYVVFRTSGTVLHPVTQKKYGYITHVIGTVRIVAVDKKYVTAQINPDTWDEVRRGDLVGPAGERLIASVTARKNERELSGFVIGTLIPFLTIHAEHSLIVLDKGGADGVLAGNTFKIVRHQDPTANVQAFINPARSQDFSLPEETIGACMIVEVKERASLCLLTKSIRDIFYGDRAVMRVAEAKSPTASLQPTGLPVAPVSR